VPAAGDPSATNPFRDVWIELLTDRKGDLARGSGTLTVEQGQDRVTINPDSLWQAGHQDRSRELYIAGHRYTIVSVEDTTTLGIDRAYEGASDEAAAYVAGSVPYGPAWLVNVPTSLVVLADNIAALQQL
jgi:hypothetical protein